MAHFASNTRYKTLEIMLLWD